MNILITGSKGQLGKCLHDLIINEKVLPEDTIFETDVEELDITDGQAVSKFIESNKIDIVVNCAAYTNVDCAEDDEQTARKVNELAPLFLSEAIHRRRGLMIHISTDYVFGNTQYNVPFVEDDITAPCNVYGKTKLGGEEFIKRWSPKHVIIRTSWLYSEYGKNFMKTMFNIMGDRLAVNVVNDQIGTPTYAGDLADVIVKFINEYKTNEDDISLYGVYHFSNEGVCSWYDFAQHIEEYGNLDCEVIPVDSRDFDSIVVRPKYSVLNKQKIASKLRIKIPYWTHSLRKCMDKYMEMMK